MHQKEIFLHFSFLTTACQVLCLSPFKQNFVWREDRRWSPAPRFRRYRSFKVRNLNIIDAHTQFVLLKHVMSSGGGDVPTHPHCVLSGTCQRAAWRQLGTEQAIFCHFKIAIMSGYVSGRLESAWEQHLADLCSGVIQPPLLWLWRPPYAGKKEDVMAREWQETGIKGHRGL
jgi:hypothetical protein